MKRTISITIILLLAIYSTAGARQKPGLKDALGKYFLVGCAMNTEQINGNDEKSVELAKTNFNAIVAENCMKPENIEPEEGKYNWTDADKIVNFGHNNNMKVIGHVLVWHSQTAPWMFQNKYGELPNREEMIKRMHDYIFTVVRRNIFLNLCLIIIEWGPIGIAGGPPFNCAVFHTVGMLMP